MQLLQINILYNSHSKKLTDNNLSCLVYAWTLQRVGLNAAINTPTAVKPTPDTHTFSAAASTQSSYKWMHHLTCLTHVSTTLDGVRTCPLHRTKLIILPLVLRALLQTLIQPQPRTRSNMAALHVCANDTKWKVMQIGDLKTSRPLLHPVASNVSLAEKFPACFSCTAIHLSTASKCLFSVLLSSYLHECTCVYNTQDTEGSGWLAIRVLQKIYSDLFSVPHTAGPGLPPLKPSLSR